MNVKDVPTLPGFHLWKPGNPSVDIPSVCLGNLSIPIFCLQEVGFFVYLVGEQPSSGYIFSWFDLSQINMIENFVVNPRFVFRVCRLNQLFIISSSFLS